MKIIIFAIVISSACFIAPALGLTNAEIISRLEKLKLYPESEIAALAKEEMGKYSQGEVVKEERIRALELYALACDFRTYCGNDVENNDEKAEAIYRRIIDMDPLFFPAANAIGVICFFNEDFDCAIKYSTLALKVNDTLMAAYADRGAAYYRLGRYDESLNDLNKAIELFHDDAWVHTMKGHVLSAQGRFEEAIISYENAEKIMPDNPDLLMTQAMLLKNSLHRSDRSLEAIERLLRWRPDHAEALAFRGTIMMEAGDCKIASRDFSRAVSLKPENIGFWNMKGQSALVCRNWDSAIASFDVCIDMNSQVGLYYWYRAQALHGRGEYQKAIDDWNRAGALEPGNERVLAGRAMTYIKLGELDKARVDIGKAVEMNSSSAKVYLAKAKLVEAEGNAEDADARYSFLVDKFPSETEFLIARADFLYNRGDYFMASKDYSRAFEIGVRDPEIEKRMLDSELRAGQYNSLFKHVRPLMEDNPEDPDIQIKYGVALRGSRGATAAVEFFDKMIETNPDIKDTYVYRAKFRMELIPDPWVHLEDIKQVAGIIEASYSDLEKAKSMSPDDEMVLNELGKTLMQKGNYYLRAEGDLETAFESYDEAIDYFLAGDRYFGNDAERACNEGVIYLKKGNLDAAAEAFERSSDKNPSAEAYRYLGVAHYLRKDFDRSISAYSKSIKLDQTDVVFNLRGNSYFRAGLYVEALKDYRVAEKLSKQDFVWVPREERYYYSVDFDPVAEIASIHGPGEPFGRRGIQLELRTIFDNRGHALVSLGDKESACIAFNRARVLGLAQGYNIHCR
ncbi:MAG TPA: tetratricopeptide repeat protein [bacterium]|nr:tetratricopeptide repeat protein [bacterium]